MHLKYLYRPKWQFDQVDKQFSGGWMEPVLHFSLDGKAWHRVPYEDYPSNEEAELRRKKFPPN
ncbi:MAG: hypothetical protein SWO11_23250 [Thermodesulfobacteriota bacterium]|nr:hypothetical protein [Thermodesulfobacteriota bacterium]